MKTYTKCGADFNPASNRQLTCSSQCSRKVHARRNRDRYRHTRKLVSVEMSCIKCGTRFASFISNQKHCSKRCRVNRDAQRRNAKKTCGDPRQRHP